MRPEDVIAVVATDFQATCRYDEPLAGEMLAQGVAAGLGVVGGWSARRWLRRSRRPRRCDEFTELGTGRPAAVLCDWLLFTHANIVAPTYDGLQAQVPKMVLAVLSAAPVSSGDDVRVAIYTELPLIT